MPAATALLDEALRKSAPYTAARNSIASAQRSIANKNFNRRTIGYGVGAATGGGLVLHMYHRSKQNSGRAGY